MKPSLTLLAATLLATVPSALHGQPGGHTLRLDLANPVLTRTVDAGSYQFVLTSRLPGTRYDIEIVREFIPIPEADLPIKGIPAPAAVADCNTALLELQEKLTRTAKEEALRSTLQTWKIGKDRDCRREGDELYEQLTTEDLRESYTLAGGQRLRVKVTRKTTTDSGETGTAEWQFVVTTEERGTWRTLYGLTFVPDHDDHFFAEELGGTPPRFVVQQERDNANRLTSQFLPSVLLAWSPTRYRSVDWSPSAVGGVGYNVDHLAVLAGFALTYNENLTFTFGAAMHQQNLLNGRYAPGDTVTGSLDDAQLLVQKYRPNFYFGIALRLSRDPFTRAAEPGESGNTKDTDTPAPITPPAETTLPPTGVDPATVAPGKKYGAYTVATVVPEGETKHITFTNAETSIVGTYAPKGSIPCVKHTRTETSNLPIKGAPETVTVCFTAADATKFDGAAENRAVEVTIHSLKMTLSLDEDPVYTATLKSVTLK